MGGYTFEDYQYGYWSQLSWSQFGGTFYLIFILIVMGLTLYIASKVAREELEFIQYYWIIFYSCIPVFILTFFSYMALTSYTFVPIYSSTGTFIELQVIGLFDEGLKSFMIYLLAVAVPWLFMFLFNKLIFKKYYQLSGTTNRIAFLVSITTAPWILIIMGIFI